MVYVRGKQNVEFVDENILQNVMKEGGMIVS